MSGARKLRLERASDSAPLGARPPRIDGTAAILFPSLVRLLCFLVALLALRYVVPATIEQVQYRLTRGRQRAEFETSGQALRSLKLNELSTAYQLISQRVGPSVVHIETRSTSSNADERAVLRGSTDPGPSPGQDPVPPSGFEKRQEQGSGVVVDGDGLIVTNHHVVAHADSVTVTLADGRRLAAEIVGSDWLTDVAVLRVDADRLIAADWGDSDQLREGALVWALGTPYGLKRSITAGIVSAKSLAGIAGSAYQDYLQTDAAVNPGSSGGPLVDVEGKVVGINTAILGDSYRGISFAVPSNIVRRVYRRIRSAGRVDRGWLGVELDDVSLERARQVGLSPPQGALIRAVGIAGENGSSPAAAAGLKPGDIVLRWNKTAIDRRETLVREVAQTDTGSRVELEVLRDGRHVTLHATVGKRPYRIN